MFCTKCGKEIGENEFFCSECGAKASFNETEATENYKITGAQLNQDKSGNVIKKENKKKKRNILIIVGASVGVLALTVCFILFRTPDLKLRDFTTPNKITAIFKFGIPDYMDDDGDWWYTDKVKFYGEKIDRFLVNFEDEKYELSYNDDNDTSIDDIESAVSRQADYERGSYTGYFKYYSYKDLEITVYDSRDEYGSVDIVCK